VTGWICVGGGAVLGAAPGACPQAGASVAVKSSTAPKARRVSWKFTRIMKPLRNPEPFRRMV
jgi:hypothetical protein